MSERLKIEKLGARGDGIAHDGNGLLYIAGGLPGETILVERDGTRGQLIEVVEASSQRASPFCPYYEACGGCITQHMNDALYREWKRDIVVQAMRSSGLTPDIMPLEDAHGVGRRRITLHVRAIKGEAEAGFMAPRSHDLVAIDQCPVTVPTLNGAPAVAREIGKLLKASAKPLSIQFTACENGLDVDIRGNGPVSDAQRQRLILLAESLDLPRIALHGDVLVERRAPYFRMGRASVIPPAGGFLQATAEGEETLSGHVRAFCGNAKRVADLFSGCGPIALRLAESADVHAVEADKASLAALERASRTAQGLRRITTEARDLFRRPLLKPELEQFDAVVMDPPRAGAEAQARQLASANVARVISVSCDPGTFARDAEILTAGGYALEKVIPVDQFKHSAHVETVALFTKVIVKKRKMRM